MSEIVENLRKLADECDDYEGDLPLGVAVALLDAANAVQRLRMKLACIALSHTDDEHAASYAWHALGSLRNSELWDIVEAEAAGGE
jgi:hypothetical protein